MAILNSTPLHKLAAILGGITTSKRAGLVNVTNATSAESCGMNLYLQKVVYSQAHDNYRVILKLDEGEFESDRSASSTGRMSLGN